MKSRTPSYITFGPLDTIRMRRIDLSWGYSHISGWNKLFLLLPSSAYSQMVSWQAWRYTRVSAHISTFCVTLLWLLSQDNKSTLKRLWRGSQEGILTCSEWGRSPVSTSFLEYFLHSLSPDDPLHSMDRLSYYITNTFENNESVNSDL